MKRRLILHTVFAYAVKLKFNAKYRRLFEATILQLSSQPFATGEPAIRAPSLGTCNAPH
jgi:hypothetical protein